MGSNPYRDDMINAGQGAYTTKFIDAQGMIANVARAIDESSPTHTLGLIATQILTGYSLAWHPTWEFDDDSDAATYNLTGRDLAKRNLFGCFDTAEIESENSAISNRYIQGLAAQNAQLILRCSTGDHSSPYKYNAQYYNKLVANASVLNPQLKITYRRGHRDGAPSEPTLTTLMRSLFGYPSLVVPGQVTHHAVDLTDSSLTVPLTPPLPYVPLVVEVPLEVGIDQEHTWEFVGEPGARVQVQVYFITGADSNWSRNMDLDDPFSLGGFGDPLPMGAFIAHDFRFQAKAFNPSLPETCFATSTKRWAVSDDLFDEAGFYWYRVLYDVDDDGIVDRILGLGDFAPPPSIPLFSKQQPVFEVISVIVRPAVIAGIALARTGGVSEDQEFL